MELRDALTSAFADSEKEETVESSTPAPVESTPAETSHAEPVESAKPVEPSASGTGEEAGKPAEKEVKSIEEVVAKPVTEPADKTPSDPRIDRAPASWKGDAKKVWAELPLNVRQEVIRRERDSAKVLQESADHRGKVEAITAVVNQNRDILDRAYGGNPVAALTNMMNVERNLSTGTPQSKAQFVASMIQHFKIDIQALDSALSGQAMPPEVQQTSRIEELLNQRLAPVMTFLEQQQAQARAQAQRTEEEVQHTVESMQNDPKFPYFEDVREDMADIIEMGSRRGVVISLEDAYTKATRLNDQTFNAVTARSQSEIATQNALAAHQQAQKAKGAAVSITGNPGTTGDFRSGDASDLRGLLNQAFEGNGARI